MESEQTPANGSTFERVGAGALFAALMISNTLAAAGVPPQGDDEAVEVEVFHEARPLSAPPASAYPLRERSEGTEGWVLLNMMIDPKGKPYEISVLDSTGNAVLDKAAVRAVQWMSFQPAKRGNTPIDGSLTFKMKFFSSEGEHGASGKFRTGYKNFTTALNAGNKDQAAQELANLVARNLYEDAFRSFGKFLFDRKWGTQKEQLADLRRTIAGESQDHYLPKDLFITALLEQLSLQIKMKDLGSALDTWKILEPLIKTPMRDQLQPTIQRIIALRNTDEVVTTSGEIDQVTGTWNGRLFKSHFSLDVASGAVAEIKLRCKKQYLFFKYDPGVQYTVSAKAGECFIEVVGDPGATFNLAQH